MAPRKDAVEFNKIIQADREKRKKQDIADRIFSRRSSAPAAGTLSSRKPPPGPSLAARVGISKASKSVRPAKSANALARAQNQHVSLHRSASTSQLNANRRNLALDAAINARLNPQNVRDQVNIRRAAVGNGAGITVKGSASQPQEFVIIAQNFAPGTTAEDIESVFTPNPDAVGLLSCKLLVSYPTVIAELAFDNRESADALVTTFNNKKADNRLLYVYHSSSQPQRTGTPRGTRQPPTRQQENPISSDETAMMDVEQSDQRSQPPPRGPRARPEVQDGRNGFDEGTYQPRGDTRSGGSGLVSDSMFPRQPRNGNYGRDRFRR